jgi:hypothetical protein
MMMRNLFVREEKDELVIGAGIFPAWLTLKEPVFFGPTPTPWGWVSVSIEHEGDHAILTLDAAWRDKAPGISIAVPGFRAEPIAETQHSYKLEKI